MTASASAATPDIYASLGRTLVVIDPSPQQRDAIAKLAAAAFRVSDFPEVDQAVARVNMPPAAIVIGDGAIAADRNQPIQRLRRHPSFARAPIVHFGARPPAAPLAGTKSDQAPDAHADRGSTAVSLIALLSKLGNKTVEADWIKLPEGPRAALTNTLGVFKGIPALLQGGEPLKFEAITQACTPVLETVRQSGHAYIFEGLRNHNDIWYVHSLRVATLLALFGHAIGLDETSLMTLASAGLVHDMGKTAYPATLTHKVATLTPEELKTAHNHVEGTSRYLREHSDAPKAVIMIAEQHHERLDGSGYPAKLKNGELNDLTRMAAIVDVFAALTERRPYRAAMAPFQALEVMQELMRDKLDQRLVRMFRDLLLKTA